MLEIGQGWAHGLAPNGAEQLIQVKGVPRCQLVATSYEAVVCIGYAVTHQSRHGICTQGLQVPDLRGSGGSEQADHVRQRRLGRPGGDE
jgi:hypothetical protein